ncbi:MAG: response regulator [Xenococcaceae cyanobacterium]
MKNLILLVEDSTDDTEIAKIAIEQSGLNTDLEVARTGRDAIMRIQRQPQPDLIILDWNLPIVSGKEVLWFAKNNVELRRIPVVILTTSKSAKDVIDAYDGYCNAYTVKPLELEDTISLLVSIAVFYCGQTLLSTKL